MAEKKKKTSKRTGQQKKAKSKKMSSEERIEKHFEDFGNEIESAVERFVSRAESKAKPSSPFSIAWPIFHALLTVLVLLLIISALDFFALTTGFEPLARVSSFIFSIIALFFFAALFFSYADYFSKKCPQGYRPFSPIVSVLAIIFALWIAFNILTELNLFTFSFPFVFSITSFAVLIALFFAIALLAYLIILLRNNVETVPRDSKMDKKSKKIKETGIKRIYRSGTDKILGGVCGGLAEYLKVDPVLIRLLWVALVLFGGTGILLYLIAWIIIPRNPGHEWDD